MTAAPCKRLHSTTGLVSKKIRSFGADHAEVFVFDKA